MSELTTIERLLLPLVRRFVSLWVRPAVLPNDVRERFAPGRPVVYVLEKRAWSTPPCSSTCAGIADCHRRWRHWAPARCWRVGAFLRAPTRPVRPADRPAHAGGVEALTGIAAADIAFDADLVPVSLFWGRARRVASAPGCV